MQTDYDFIIIGAGPAGASCAKHLVENGVKTLIIEKRTLPRYKCCGGLLSKRSVDFLKTNFGDIPENILSNPKSVTLKMSINFKKLFFLLKYSLILCVLSKIYFIKLKFGLLYIQITKFRT